MKHSSLKPNAPTFHPSSSAPTTTTPTPNASKQQPQTRPSGAWGKKPSDAIRSAAPPPQQTSQKAAHPQQQQQKAHAQKGQQQKSQSKSNGWRREKQNKQEDGNWSRGKDPHRRSGGRGRGGSGGGGGGGGRGANKNDDGWQRGKSLPLELLKSGDGKTDSEKAVNRIPAEEFLAMRLRFTTPPLSWEEEGKKPPETVLWMSETRVEEIMAISKAPRMMGDVSQRSKRPVQKEETAPPLEECAPIAVNEETRWKAKVFEGKKEEEDDSDDAVLKKALLILNKLSLTKFDKLSDKFVETGIGRNEACLKGAIGLIVDKAQQEPHFSAMYASLCIKLSKIPMDALGEKEGKKGKKFKKLLLTRCQEEFEQDIATKMAKVSEEYADEEERQYHANIVKKNYLGHMRFIGELYKGDLVSIKIILLCIPHLLDLGEKGDVDEEKVECFAQLMTTIGASLERQSQAMKSVGKHDAAKKLAECWRTVEALAGAGDKGGGPTVSNRIKFMLQDLIDLRSAGWKTGRKEETPKTIAQIHKEVAKEEARAMRSASSGNLRALAQSSASLRRGNSSGDFRKLQPAKDEDGFVQVQPKSMGRSFSAVNLTRSASEGYNAATGGSKQRFSYSEMAAVKKTDGPKRNTSGGSFAAFNEQGWEPAKKGRGTGSKGDKKPKKADSSAEPKPDTTAASAAAPETTSKPEPTTPSPQPPTPTPPKTQQKTLDECKANTKSILKEYFIGGDTDDAVLSLQEMIGTGDGSSDRGAAVMESGTLLVLEMKRDDVDKFLTVLLRCLSEQNLTTQSILLGLRDPLEFLNDIVIDAPMASKHLSAIVAKLVEGKHIDFDSLLLAPEYFLTDGNPARFACQVLNELGDEAKKDEKNVDVVKKLMTKDDKKSFSCAEDMIGSVK